MISTPHPEQFLYATTTLLDSVVVNGHGETAYVTRTLGSLTTLFRVDTVIGGLKRVSTVDWLNGSGRPSVTIYDIRSGTMSVVTFQDLFSLITRIDIFRSVLDDMKRQRTKHRGRNPPFPSARRYILNWPQHQTALFSRHRL